MAIKHLRHRAFTLVELIVVITILAILATVWFLSLSGYSDDARAATVKANVRTVYSAILTESTTSGNSPRYYVSHDATAALSGAFVFVDGKQVALTGGDLGVGDSNYTAGNPRWDRLRMNGEKFRLSWNGKRPVPPLMGEIADGNGTFPVPQGAMPEEAFAKSPEAGTSPSSGGLPYAFGGFGAYGNEARAAYSSGELAVGAVDVFKTGANGRKRATPFFQVAGVVAGSKKAVVVGNLTSGTADGLVKDPGASNASASLTDGLVSNFSVPESCKAMKAANPSATDGTYWIDPDGTGGNAEFRAYCDMTTDGGGWTLVASVVNQSSFWSPSSYNSSNSARAIDIGIPSPTSDYVMQLGKWKTLLGNGGTNSWFRLKVRRIDNDADVTLGFLRGLQMKSDGWFVNALAAFDGNMVEKNAVNACIIQYNSNFDSTIVFNYFDSADTPCTGYMGWNGYCGYPSLGHNGSYASSGTDKFSHACSLDNNYYCSADNMTWAGNAYCYFKRKWYWIK